MGKIIKNGIDYGGGVAVDSTLDATSMNAVANKPVAEAITQLNNDLTANSNKFEATYQNGKYGFMINGTFYEIGGGGMPKLNYSTPLYTFGASKTSYTAVKDCYLVGEYTGNDIGAALKINNTAFGNRLSSNFSTGQVFLPLATGDVVTITGGVAGSTLHILEES